MCADNKEDEMLRTLFLLLVSLFSMPWCVANASQRDVMADSARSALSAGNSSAGTVSPASGIWHISDAGVYLHLTLPTILCVSM